jgi:hypothetical protein
MQTAAPIQSGKKPPLLQSISHGTAIYQGWMSPPLNLDHAKMAKLQTPGSCLGLSTAAPWGWIAIFATENI